MEINNTDAEGRLVLADGVAYAVKHLAPRVILDMATLTGAQGVATGRRHAALYANDEVRGEWVGVSVKRITHTHTHLRLRPCGPCGCALTEERIHPPSTIFPAQALEAALVAVGKETGDLAHPMPYAPEFFQAGPCFAVPWMFGVCVCGGGGYRSSSSRRVLAVPWVFSGGEGRDSSSSRRHGCDSCCCCCCTRLFSFFFARASPIHPSILHPPSNQLTTARFHPTTTSRASPHQHLPYTD